jgi:hypothetical protein
MSLQIRRRHFIRGARKNANAIGRGTVGRRPITVARRRQRRRGVFRRRRKHLR